MNAVTRSQNTLPILSLSHIFPHDKFENIILKGSAFKGGFFKKKSYQTQYFRVSKLVVKA